MRPLRGVRTLFSIMVVPLGPDSGPIGAEPQGTPTIAMQITLATRWLDPAEGESIVTPFRFHDALHDGLRKPMPCARAAPSLANRGPCPMPCERPISPCASDVPQWRGHYRR